MSALLVFIEFGTTYAIKLTALTPKKLQES